MTDTDALLRLAFAGLTPRTIQTLVTRQGGVERALRAVSRRGGDDVAAQAVRVDANRRREELSVSGVRFLADSDDGFPDRLQPHDDAPRWLFVRGPVPDPGLPTVGIVGSRSATRYGLDLAYALGERAAVSGWVVVSGLARGIDGAAHRGALSASGACIGVLGCGADVVYPREHQDLYREVAASGALLSEYPPRTTPAPWRFPARNRIVAGLSDLIVVVEASDRGGALITAGVALDYGVPVHAVPGDIDRPTSVGTNRLIRDGAFPVLGCEDFAEVLGVIADLRRVGASRTGSGAGSVADGTDTTVER